MPIFRVKSVKIYTDQKNLHEYIRGVRDKYQIWGGIPHGPDRKPGGEGS